MTVTRVVGTIAAEWAFGCWLVTVGWLRSWRWVLRVLLWLDEE